MSRGRCLRVWAAVSDDGDFDATPADPKPLPPPPRTPPTPPTLVNKDEAE